MRCWVTGGGGGGGGGEGGVVQVGTGQASNVGQEISQRVLNVCVGKGGGGGEAKGGTSA